MTFLRPRPATRRPTLSVVVPCYNYGHFLPDLVDGLISQPGVTTSVIIVDDASPDGSGLVAEQLASQHPDVSVIRHHVNRGHIATYNDGLDAVTGEYVVLLSADDLLPTGAPGRAVALMEAHPRVGMVYGFARSFSGTPPEPVSTVRNWSVWKGFDWLALSARRGRSFISSPEVVMRTAALREVGGYDPRLPHSGDLDMWLRTALSWDIGRVNGPTQAHYRVHASNMHLTTYAGWLTDLRERRTTFELLFNEHARARKDVQSLRPHAARALAVEALRRGLVASRDEDPGLLEDYVRFALETDKTVQSTLWWYSYRLGPGRGIEYPAAYLRRFGSRVNLHARWLWGRRYGT